MPRSSPKAPLPHMDAIIAPSTMWEPAKGTTRSLPVAIPDFRVIYGRRSVLSCVFQRASYRLCCHRRLVHWIRIQSAHRILTALYRSHDGIFMCTVHQDGQGRSFGY